MTVCHAVARTQRMDVKAFDGPVVFGPDAIVDEQAEVRVVELDDVDSLVHQGY